MIRHASVLLVVLVFAGFSTCARAQAEPKNVPLEDESISQNACDDSRLPNRFNSSRPFVISFNEKIPDARPVRAAIVRSLGQKGLLDLIVFEWFGSTEPETIEIKFGAKVPLAVSQSVLKALSRNKDLKLVLSVSTTNNEFGDMQRVYVGSLVKSGKQPVTPRKLQELLSDDLTLAEFIEMIEELK